ncbi:hypothetical protein HaLaN_25019, partial [Haematococcus lacustris]
MQLSSTLCRPLLCYLAGQRQGLDGYKPTSKAKEGNKLGEENSGTKGKGAYREEVNTATRAKPLVTLQVLQDEHAATHADPW